MRKILFVTCIALLCMVFSACASQNNQPNTSTEPEITQIATEQNTEKQSATQTPPEVSTEQPTEAPTEISTEPVTEIPQSEPVYEKTDLYNYLGTDLYQFIDIIGNMHDVGATDGTKEFSNGTIIVSARPNSGDEINFFSLRAKSDYCIKGIEPGMTMEEAASLLSDFVITDDLDYYKRFVIDSQYYISFGGENGVVDSISVGSTE